MIRLYQLSGSGEISYIAKVNDAEWEKYKKATIRLLEARKHNDSADVLKKYDFKLYEGTNVFGDEFHYLSAECELDDYVNASEEKKEKTTYLHKDKFDILASTITEIGPFIRFIVVELTKDEPKEIIDQPKLTITAEKVKEALADAEQLLKSRSATSAVDRLHTAFHGFLQEQCEEIRSNTIQMILLQLYLKF